MQRRVAEYRVELVFEIEALRVPKSYVDPARFRGADERLRCVDADDRRAGGGDAFGQGPIAAPEIEDPLAGLRREEIDERRAEIGNEASVACVLLCVPDLQRRSKPAYCVAGGLESPSAIAIAR